MAEPFFPISLFLKQFHSGSAVNYPIMTGIHRAASAAQGTPATPSGLPKVTTIPGPTQSGGHSPNKFMSELRSIHSELDTEPNVHPHGLNGLTHLEIIREGL